MLDDGYSFLWENIGCSILVNIRNKWYHVQFWLKGIGGIILLSASERLDNYIHVFDNRN
jgi:hypothetical protein